MSLPSKILKNPFVTNKVILKTIWWKCHPFNAKIYDNLSKGDDKVICHLLNADISDSSGEGDVEESEVWAGDGDEFEQGICCNLPKCHKRVNNIQSEKDIV